MKNIHEVEQLLNVWGFPEKVTVPVLGDVQPKVIVMTWIVMLLVALFTVAATR